MAEVSQSGEESGRDNALIASWIAGSDAALETLLRHYQTRIFSFLGRMLRNPHDAEDATQEAFIRAARHLHRFDPRKSAFKSWMFQIAYREGLRLAGKRKQAPIGEGAWTAWETPPPEAVDPAPLPGEDLIEQETAAVIAQAVDSLPEAEKQVVLLRIVSGLRFREISEMMNAPLNTTLGRMHNATQRLKEWLGERPAAT